MNLQINTFIFCSALLDGLSFVNGEYFTSIDHLKWLLEIELELAYKLKSFIQQEELRINQVKSFCEQIESHTTTESLDTSVLHNPVSSYQFLRRMTTEWPKIHNFSRPKENEVLETFTELRDILPDGNDMEGAKDGLIRLQETFDLPSKQIVEGILQETPNTTRLGAEDAFDIGLAAHDALKPHLTTGWMTEALRLIDIGRISSPDTKPLRVSALDYLHWSEYQNENNIAAIHYGEELLRLEPDHPRILKNMEYLNNLESYGNNTSNESETTIVGEKPNYAPFYYTDEENPPERISEEARRVNTLCRGKTRPIPSKDRKHLICWYKRDHPLLVLKPGKVERLYVYPEIYMFRDILRDGIMEKVKGIAASLLDRATVFNPKNGKQEHADYRVSKSAWIDLNESSMGDKLNNRISAYTGLNMATAEKLQVANYGIGGYYAHHFDFSKNVPIRPPPWKNRTDYTYWVHPSKRQYREDGERIATLLFYLSDVEIGGATVFTNIGQAVKPSKGDAVFWFNLNHDGSGDYLTRHAACPVLIGEKWVSNRWIHERGQEFVCKCNRRIEDERNCFPRP